MRLTNISPRLIAIHVGEQWTLAEEGRGMMAIDPERHARIMAAVGESPHDALLCSSASEVLLLTGYWPVMGESIAVFYRTGEVKVVLPGDELEIATATSAAELVPYTPAGLHTLDSPLTQLAETLQSVTENLALANVGTLMKECVQPASYVSGTQFRSSLLKLLRDMHRNATFESCDEMVELMKATKTRKELEAMETACRVAADGFAAAQEAIEVGMRETEIAAAVQGAFESSPEALSFQRSYGSFFCMSGPNSAKASAAFAHTRQRTIESGDLVMIHANTCGDGFWTDLTRTFLAGQASQEQSDMRAAILEARAAGLKAIAPKVLGRDVDHAVRSVMERHGYGPAFKHATGHGVGFAATNPNGRPRIHPLSEDVLEEGMTFNLEPAAYFDGYGGMRHCDVVSVSANGANVMSQF